jgi:hypothetical protein
LFTPNGGLGRQMSVNRCCYRVTGHRTHDVIGPVGYGRLTFTNAREVCDKQSGDYLVQG